MWDHEKPLLLDILRVNCNLMSIIITFLGQKNWGDGILRSCHLPPSTHFRKLTEG
jgi:hypothetical protein